MKRKQQRRINGKGIGVKMNREERIQEMIQTGRNFMRPEKMGGDDLIEGYVTDQNLKKPQPPLYKEPMGGKITMLPSNYHDLMLRTDIVEILYKRKSSRVYTQEQMSLLELAYLLWATQGVKEIRGNNYATLRTVACGGARHEFECYIAVRNVEGLTPGFYHYMPDKHAVELIEEIEEDAYSPVLEKALIGKKWAHIANVVFFYSVIPYRAEWRYGIWSHRVQLIDSGHITQNLYVACSGANDLGTCAIGELNGTYCDQLFHLDGEEEFIFYAASAGKISEANKKEEDAFYAFLKEE